MYIFCSCWFFQPSQCYLWCAVWILQQWNMSSNVWWTKVRIWLHMVIFANWAISYKHAGYVLLTVLLWSKEMRCSLFFFLPIILSVCVKKCRWIFLKFGKRFALVQETVFGGFLIPTNIRFLHPFIIFHLLAEPKSFHYFVRLIKLLQNMFIMLTFKWLWDILKFQMFCQNCVCWCH